MNAIVKLKNFAIVTRTFSSKPLYEEIKIPLSWGQIAAKWWGPQDNRPILVLHGWQDNCGSFDRLIPLLNQRRGYLAIDFPGHGLSSNLPVGTSYYWTDYVTTVRRVVQHFKWPKVSILGHSIGAAMGYYYELVYSGEVDFLICIDALHPIMRDVNVISHGKGIDTILKYEQLIAQGDEGPLYSKEQLVEKLHSDSFASIDLNMCEYILKRNTKESAVVPGKFYFTRDMRLKVLPLLYNNRYEILNTVDRLQCPTLYFKAKFSAERYKNLTNPLEVANLLKTNKINFEMHVLEGTHHLHLNQPEKLAGHINKFIDKYDTECKNGN